MTARHFLLIALSGLVGVMPASAKSPTVFTYQGSLDVSGSAYTGSADFRFTLYDALSGGSVLAGPAVVGGVEVERGLFALPIDFGQAGFGPGSALRIEVRTPAWDGVGAEPAFFAFAERTLVTGAPYALSTRGITVSGDGSRVGIGTDDPMESLDVVGNARVAGTLSVQTAPEVLDQAQTVQSEFDRFTTVHWQTFVPGVTGWLTRLEFEAAPSPSTFVDVGIYEGVGSNTTPIAARPTTVGPGQEAIVFDPPALVRAGQTYTVAFIGPGFVLAYNPQDEYAAGVRGPVTASGDIFFRTFVRPLAQLDLEGEITVNDADVTLLNTGVSVIGGDVGIGTSQPVSPLHVAHGPIFGGWSVRIQNSAAPGWLGGVRLSDTGFLDVTNRIDGLSFARLSGNGMWTAVSDARAKEDIHHLSDALDRAMRLEPVTYRYKGTELEEIGFTAQDVAEQFPSLVAEGADLMTLNYSGLSTVAIAALQELKAEKDRELAELRALVESMATELAELRRERRAD